MLSCRSFCANVAASAYPIHRFLYLRRTFDVNFRRFGASCNHSSSSSSSGGGCSISSDMNFSPSINRGIRSFLSKAPRHSLAARAVSDLRSNHAGEWGAVKIYEGAEMAAQWRLSCTVDSRALVDLTTLINFVQRHRDSESKHLLLMSEMLEPNLRTRLLPLWSVAGFLLGAVRRSSETKPIPVFTAPPSAGPSADWGPLCSVVYPFHHPNFMLLLCINIAVVQVSHRGSRGDVCRAALQPAAFAALFLTVSL